MSRFDGLCHRIRAALRRSTYERELAEEIRFHLDVEAMHEERAGRSGSAAYAAARQRFGNVTRATEEVRRASGVAFLDVLRQDLRFAFRSWGTRGGRGPAIVTVLTFAVGIGAMTAIYSIVQAILIRPLPVRDPERLVSIQVVEPAERGRAMYGGIGTMELVRAWSRDATVLDGIAAFALHRAALTGLGPTRSVRAFPVTTNMFEFLGVRPVRGRGFLPNEGTAGARPVTVVNSTFATKHFGSDSAAIGRLVTLDGIDHEIVGVMASDFHVPGSVRRTDAEGEMWTPVPVFPDRARSVETPADVLARLARGVTEAGARAQLDTILAATALPSDLRIFGRVTHIVSPHRLLVDNVRTPLSLLAGGSALLLLIACANVANLMLARAVVRRREIAVRMALGAGRLRLVRQLLTESITLSLIGGTLGVLVAYGILPVGVHLAGEHLPPVGTIAIDAGVLGVALTVTILLGILVGLAPVAEAGKDVRHPALKEGAANTTMSRRSRWTSDGLVATQVGLALVLLTGMGLIARSFVAVMTLDRGYDTESVLVTRVIIPERRYAAPEDRATLARAVLERLETLPGVTSAAAADAGPILTIGTSRFTTSGASPTPESPRGHLWTVSATYFQTMGVPLRRGRVATNSAEVVIDESAVRAFFADGDALGQRLTWGNARRPSPATSGQGVVVGIVGDIRELATATSTRVDTNPHVYRLLSGERADLFMVRVAGGDPERLNAEVRRVFDGIDPGVIVDLTQSGSGMVHTWFTGQRFLTQLMLALAGIAFFLATIGIYSVVSYAAARRTREMGIRVALGAQRLNIVSLVMRRAMMPVAIGVLVGLAATVAFARVLRSQLFDVSPTDPLVLIGVTAMLGIAALVASYLPSRRATRVEPTVVLREE